MSDYSEACGEVLYDQGEPVALCAQGKNTEHSHSDFSVWNAVESRLAYRIDRRDWNDNV